MEIEANTSSSHTMPPDQLQEFEKSLQELSIPPSPTTSQFSIFPDFPTEIRLLIWNMATDQQRIVAIRSCGKGGGFGSATPQPAILYVCQESRQVALMKYELTFSGLSGDSHSFLSDSFPPKTYFNFERDIVYFRKIYNQEERWEDDMTVARFGLHINRKHFDRVKAMGIDVKSSYSSTSLSWLNYQNPRDLRTIYLCTEDGVLKAEKALSFEPLEEKDYDRFVADTRNDLQTYYWPQPGFEMKVADAMEIIQSKGNLDYFLKLKHSLQLGDTPNFCLVKVINGEI